MSDTVHARVSAVKQVHHALTSYERGFATALASGRADANRASAEVQEAVAASQRRLLAADRRVAAAQGDLARCRENCEPLARALAQARVEHQEADRRHARNRQAQDQLERASAELLSSLRAADASSGELLPAGRRFVQDYAEMLSTYLASS